VEGKRNSLAAMMRLPERGKQLSGPFKNSIS
jgi:hypothetical protein